MRSLLGIPVVVALAVSAACAPPELGPVGRARQAISAPCVATVAGTGEVDVELDYLPHVVACENGAAPFEALRAQAVAARSYLAYKQDAYPGQPIQDGTGDQVYTCANTPQPIHYEAVASTSGEILRYEDTVVAAFYVAGAVPSAASCVAAPGDNDSSGTEHYVTYNQGNAGLGLVQTTLGFVAPTNWANRGCHSQNGASCHALAGRGYDDILRFYYGADIEVVVGDGECTAPDDTPYVCGTVPATGSATWGLAHPCVVVGCAEADAAALQDDDTALLPARADRDCVVRHRLSLDAPRALTLAVDVPDVDGLTSAARYLVRHEGEDTVVVVDQAAHRGARVVLGTFAFAAGRHQWLELDDATADASAAVAVAATALVIGDAAPLVDGGGGDDGGHAADAGVVIDAGLVDEDAGALDEELPPSVQECACVIVADPRAPGAAVALGLMAAARRRRGSSSRAPRGGRAGA